MYCTKTDDVTCFISVYIFMVIGYMENVEWETKLALIKDGLMIIDNWSCDNYVLMQSVFANYYYESVCKCHK